MTERPLIYGGTGAAFFADRGAASDLDTDGAAGLSVVLAPNPKDYTGPGTNTYLIEHADGLWVLDPGPATTKHLDAVLDAVGDRSVSGILIVHGHLDHSPAGRDLSALTGAPIMGPAPLNADLMARTTEDVDPHYRPDIILRDGDCLGSGAETLQVVHTPGHFPHHLAYFRPHDGCLFTGDHVLGWSTTVVVPPLGNLPDYLDSLRKLMALKARIAFASHGEPMTDPQARMTEILQHRHSRHQQICACLEQGFSDITAIVDLVYQGLSPRLRQAAHGQVQAHMDALADWDGLIGDIKEA